MLEAISSPPPLCLRLSGMLTMDRCNCREKERKGAWYSRHSRMYALDFEEAEKNLTIFTPS